MNELKRQKYIENMYACLHTLSGKSNSVDLSKAEQEEVVKTAYPKKRQGEDVYDYYMQLNPNKSVGDTTMIKGYSQFQKVLLAAFDRIEADEFWATRVDMALNSDDETDYESFKKLNKLLICCIADKYNMKNCYHTTDLWTHKSLSVAVKNSTIEVENYNKDLESDGKTEAKNRLEMRSKGLKAGSDIKGEFSVKWFKRLDDAYERFDSVQERFNKELFAVWVEDQEKDKKERTFSTWTSFLLIYKDCIFTKKQLASLYKMYGVKNPEKSAHTFKDRHKIEFYSKKDLAVIIEAIKNCILEYFSK